MWFNNEAIIIGDTSTPTTYEISGTLDPNVGQYGWTKADQGHYNQLAAYVADAKKYYEQTAVFGDYAKQAIVELNRIDGMIVHIDTESDRVEKLAGEIHQDTIQSGIYHNNVSTMNAAIILSLNEIRAKYLEIVAIGEAADKDAESAKQDATLAADYYLRTKAMYDEWKATRP